ncbi:MAG: sugar phosphate nucleotidyltransferase [Thermoplasmata archaeon]
MRTDLPTNSRKLRRALRPLRGVLTLAGAGTRMLPWSRGLRKEFLPLYDRGHDGSPVLKPLAHLVLETLTSAGVSDVTLVVQPTDLALVRNYFTVDPSFLEQHRQHPERLVETREFYRRLVDLRIRYALQPRPTGFGDAVLRSEPRLGGAPFLLHASDALLLEPARGTLPHGMGELLRRESLDAVLLVRRVPDARRYGVVVGREVARYRSWRRLDVSGMEEKPTHPRSHWAATAVYAFAPTVFDALRSARRKAPRGSELELTHGIADLLAGGGRVAALVLEPADAWRSVGSPDGFYRALRATYGQLSGARPKA